jgi:hypothetical protein
MLIYMTKELCAYINVTELEIEGFVLHYLERAN